MVAWSVSRDSVAGRKGRYRCPGTTITIRVGGNPKGGFSGSKNLQNIWPELIERLMRLPIMPCDYCMAKIDRSSPVW